MRTAVLADVAEATPRTRRLRLAVTGGPFTFRAGQAVFAGLSGADTRAPYSIASPPALAAAGTIELLVTADGAFGVPDDAAAAPLLLVAGGTGIAPLRSVIFDRLGTPGHPPATLVYSVRTPDEFAFADEFQALEASGRLRLHLTVTRDDSPSGQPARSGRVDAALLRTALPAPDAVCLVCGPSGFVQAITATLAELGVPPGRIVVER